VVRGANYFLSTDGILSVRVVTPLNEHALALALLKILSRAAVHPILAEGCRLADASQIQYINR
jgi:hypothetical protein